MNPVSEKDLYYLSNYLKIRKKIKTHLRHTLRVPKQIGAVAHFSFDDLCQEGLGVPLGAQDYLALASEYSAIVIHDVPRIDLYVMNSALKRFIILVDQLYDNNVGSLFLFETHLGNIAKLMTVLSKISVFEKL